jgi:hypothetical protein
MAETNRKHASRRMKDRNPMRLPDVRASVAETLRKIGHRPPWRGGNGTGPSPGEQAMIDLIPEAHSNFIVPTGQRIKGGLPSHYKIDVAIPEVLLAIEVDGGSHALLSRQDQDARKTAFLEDRGWTVLRFSNRQVLEDPASVLGMVTSTILRLRERTPTSPTAS